MRPSSLAFLFAVFDVALGHVTLVFPEARYPPLDFLDSARTHGQCGVPKSTKSAYTILQTATRYELAWRLQYPHQGGFRLSVIDSSGKLLEELTSAGNASQYEGLDAPTTDSFAAMFRRPCTNCTLLLERQALEWGKSYVFRSCADIHVVEPSVPTGINKCSGHGEWNHEEKVCFCERKRSGKWCQYQHDCQDDTDCMNDGKCTAGGVSPRTKSCFCPFGYFGINCENEPVVQEDTQCFKYTAPGEDGGQFTYGLFNQSCYKKVMLENGDFVFSRVVDDQMEIVLDYKTESYVAFGWRPLFIPETCRLFPDLAATALEQSTEAKNAGYLKSALEAPLHPMDCTDIVMASVINGSYLHIEDMYTRDRSTPLRDEVVDGEQSLTAAYGVQRGGRTIVAFRRGIREIEPSDHPLGPGRIFAIYAKGQTPGAYKHVAPSGIDKDNQTDATASFYPNDQFKYHGMKWVMEVLWFIQMIIAMKLNYWT